MLVFDSTGTELGRVELTKMADPPAVTARGQKHGDAARVVHVGYIKIDGKRVYSVDRYAFADQIADVTDDTVRLAVPGDQLITER